MKFYRFFTHIRILIAVALTVQITFAQELKERCNFTSPVRHTIVSSGSFGEPRSAHFHSGIDIKPYKGAGRDELLAIADGYVSRIRITPDSYGKAIYITHPCGYTSVYAHMDRFNHDLTAYINRVRIATRKSEIDQKPPINALMVNKGEVIGYIGNSGNSFGAHLHFEIRETKSEVPINPVLFGIGPEDNIPPIIRGIMVYYLDMKRNVIDKFYYPAYQNSRGIYTLQKKELVVDWPLIGIGLHVFDQSNGAGNHNSIHSLKYSRNGINQFSFALDSIPFDKSQFIHAHLDYERKINNKYVHKCFTEPLNTLNIYNSHGNHGLILTNSIIPDQINIVTQDAKGNEAKIDFNIKKSNTYNIIKSSTYHKLTISPPDSNHIKCGNYIINIPPYSVLHNASITCDSILYGIELSTPVPTPFFKNFIISTQIPNNTTQKIKSKYIFILYSDKGKIINLGGHIAHDNEIEVKHNVLGKIQLVLDTISPSIRLISKKNNSIRLSVIDNFRSEDSSTRIRYNAYIDGTWVPVEYDEKINLLEYTFGDQDKGHIFTLEALDYSNNKANFKIILD